ncbi:MAG: TVP38/TMEM64 family protein [Alphaproteobacteria bacterium]
MDTVVTAREDRAALARDGAGAPDADRRRRLAVLVVRALVLVAVIVAAIAMLSAEFSGLPRDAAGRVDFSAVFDAARESPWAAALVTGSYVLLNFAGVPQFLLVGATVIVFGPWLGFVYAWFGTLVSSSVGFWLGHFFGAELLRRFGGARVNRISERFARRGALAAATVRVVPAGPAILVNMAFGMSHVSYGKFLLGTGLGIFPKVGLIALVGEGVFGLLSGGNLMVVGSIAGLVMVWLGAFWFMKRSARRWQSRASADPSTAVQGPAQGPAPGMAAALASERGIGTPPPATP